MSPEDYSEDELVEQPAMELLAELGWDTINAYSETLGPGGTLGRDSQHDAFLPHRLREALVALNPTVPEPIREEALAAITRDRSLMLPVRANQEIHELLREGHRAEWVDEQGEAQFAVVRYIDLHDSAKNDWLAVNQFWLTGPLHQRRPDAVLFVNGIPLVLLEFKGATISIEHGYDDNICDYRDTVPQLFSPNGFIIISNGSEAKVGATYATWATSATGKSSTQRAAGASSPSTPRFAVPAPRTTCSTSSRTSSPTSNGPGAWSKPSPATIRC